MRDIVKTPVGKAVNVVVERGNTKLILPVTVAEWPRSKWEERDAPSLAERPSIRIRPDLGLSLVAIPTSKRGRLGLENIKGGVLVADVVPGSDAASRGMRCGDIILRADHDTTASPGDVWKAIRAERAEKHELTTMLVLQKQPKSPGAEWVVLRLLELAG